MSKKAICFVSGSIKEATFLFLIGEEIQKKYHKDFYIVFSRKFLYDYFKKAQKMNIYYLDWNVKEISEKMIEESLLRYKEFPLQLSFLSDSILSKKKRSYASKVITKHILFWENFIDEKNIERIIHYPTATVLGRTSYVVALKKKIKHLIVQTGPVVTDTFTICDINENWIWQDFINQYIKNPIAITDKTKRKIEAIVEKIISIKNKSIQIRKISLKILAGLIFKGLKYKKRDAIEKNEIKKFSIPFFRKYIMWQIRYDKFSKKDKSIFFPLHISWDAQIATRNPMFANQLYLIEILSKALPFGYTLYVKEHPYNYAGEPIGLLKKIQSFENVKLIYPGESSLKMIQAASAVVTINSTAGFETILLKKPLLTFGKTFYSYFKYAHTIEHLNELPNLLQKVLFSDWEKIVKSKTFQDEWVRFIEVATKTSSQGGANSYKNYMGLGINLLSDNIAKITKSLMDR